MRERCDGSIRICPSQRPLFSAKPSPILIRPTQFVSTLRDILNAVSAAGAVGSARPSPSVAPSPWVIRNPINLTSLGLPRPEAIVSRIGFGGANITELMNPAKLQELVIQLGCTFRMPLENVRITNITLFDVLADKFRVIPFDPAIVNLRSDGLVVCMPPLSSRNTLVNRNLRGRELQTSTSSTNVNVEYAILDPSDNILSLDDAELGAILASSPLNDFQASIGAGELAYAPSAGGASPSPKTATGANSMSADDKLIRIGLGVGLGVIGFAAAVAVGVLIARRRTQTRQRRPTRSVHVVFTSQPMNATRLSQSHITGTSERRIYNPIGSRV
jgi:hypothetical protein